MKSELESFREWAEDHYGNGYHDYVWSKWDQYKPEEYKNGQNKVILDEMAKDMFDGQMPVGEIEGCLVHWGNKYVINRRTNHFPDTGEMAG